MTRQTVSICIFLFICLIGCSNGEEGPLLQTNIGEFEGKLLDFDGKVSVEAFYGLPFAKKPNKFEKPEPPEPFKERRFAVDHKSACNQIPFRAKSNLEGSDDCLYLNLFKPHEKSHDGKGYPLVLFVHGGAYQAGSALGHSQNYMAEWQALLWIRENAKQMDIDVDRITLWGYSAGASIASHMTLSEHTRDLFAQVIQMSGGGFNEWSLTESTVKTTLELAEKLGCSKKEGRDIKKCFQSFDDESILDAVREIPDIGLSLKHLKFAPRLDNDFFRTNLWSLLEDAPPKPTLSSILENECLVFVAYDAFLTSHYIPAEERKKFDLKSVEKLFREDWFTKERFGEKAEEVMEKVLDFYVKRPSLSPKDNNFYLNEYSRFISDQTLVVTQMRELLAKVRNGWPVYNLLNTHRENLNRNFPDAISSETVHGADISFLYGVPLLGDLNFTKTDREYRDHLIGAILEFVKSGNPNSDNKHDFVQATKKRPFAYTVLNHEIKVSDGLFKDSVEFWDDIINEYGYDIFFGIPLNEWVKQTKDEL
ncbi:Carboxylic ester hydrolase [Aphelenchoides bicaudatus]|nr:Carboxylic ester hydrolase [Aphelenchoides bicaudatus]